MALPQESQGLFERANIPVFYSGVGKINAAHKATELILKHKPRRLVNLGTAGSRKWPTETLVECRGFVQRDMDLTAVGGKLGTTPFDEIADLIEVPTLTDLTKGICGTGDRIEVNDFTTTCDLMDMEAYALAKVCKRMGVEFTSIKFISDRSDENLVKDWKALLKIAAENLLMSYKNLVLRK